MHGSSSSNDHLIDTVDDRGFTLIDLVHDHDRRVGHDASDVQL